MKRILFFVGFIFSIASYGQSSQTYLTSGTFTVPAGVTSISVEAWGAGGGGHNSFNKGGGGGAFAATYSIAVIPNTTYNVNVGVGGTAGNDGQDSSFGTFVIAKAGKSGITGNGGLASESTGVVKFDGGNGGSSTSNGGGGGGGAAGTLNNGLVGANSSNNNGGNGGNGGANGGGNGGRGGNNNQDGVNGIAPGGGGGERGENGGSSGGGGNGQVIVSWTCPVFAATSYGTAQSICYNNDVAGTNIGRVTFSNVPTDRYVAVNVVSGIQYRIATTNGDRGFVKRLTLFNGGNTTTALATTNATATNTAATIDWTATFTGVLYVVFNTANCQTSTQTDDITASYIGGGNNVDNQTTSGIDSWIGHVYNFLDSVPIGGGGSPGPSDGDAFSSYIGYFTQSNTVSGSTISFNNGYGGNDNCLNVTAGGTIQSVRTETFSVRYRMQTTSAVYPAGCYFVNIAGDDGVRLYIDGTLVFNSWIQQGTTNYNNVLVYLNGNSQLLLDFYEKNGGNVSNFSIFPAGTTINGLNTVTPAGPITRCTNTPTLLTGGIVATQGNNTIAPVQYQWQSSTDNTTWTDISGATSLDYTFPGTSPAAATQIYFRRNVRSTVNSSACVYSSNVVSIITSSTNTTPSVPTLVAGTNITCSSFTANWSSSPSATSYRLDVSTVSNFANFVSGYQDLPVGFVTSYNVSGLGIGTYYYRVRAVNGCGNTTSSSQLSGQAVTTVNPSATISGTTSVCQNAASPNITFANPTSSAITVTYRINSGANQTINVGANTTANVAAPTTTSGTFAYSLVSVAYQAAPTCSTAITGAATITVNSLSVAPTGILGTTTICSGSSTTLTINGGSAGTGATVQWFSGSCGSTVIGTGNAITVSPTSNTTYFVRYNGTCNTTTCASATVTVNSLSVAPTGILGTTTICSGGSTTLTINGGSAGTGATVQWFSGSCGSTVIGTGNAITVSPTATTTYFVRYSGTCNITTCASTTVTVTPTVGTPSTPTPSASTICQASSPTAYTTSATNATSYTWSVTGTGNTISGTGTTGTVTWAAGFSGSATVSVVANGCNGPSASASTTVTVSPNNTVGSPSSSPNLCIGTLMTSITHTTTGATGIGTASGLPAGVSASWASNTITISGTPTASGTFNYSIPLDGGCGSVLNATGTITVNPSPTFTTAGVVNPVIFNLSTTISTGLPYTASTNNPVSYTIDWNTIADQGTTPFVFAAGGGTVTGILVPAGTAVGTYTGTMTITTGSGCVFNQAITLTVQPSPAPPLGVSPNLWLKANTGVTNSGASLSTWTDQTGINTFTKQGTIGYNTNAINFNPTASFSHDSSVQTEPTNKLDGNTAIDIGQAFAVYRNFASSNKRNTTLLGNVDAINKGFKGVFFGISLSPTYIYFENSGSSFAAYEAFPNNNGYDQFAVQTLDFSPTAAPFANAWSNSKNILVEPAGGPQADYTVISSVTPLIGGINNLNNYNFNGEVAEIITYPSGLTPLERTKIESYLAIKYGITLDPTIAYYLSNTGNQLWNNTTTYWHDVFGIGREDAYGLNQSQSNSINTGSGDGTGQNGKGNIVLSNPSSLDDGDFLMIGHNNAALTEITTDLPSSLSGSCVRRLTREWKVKRTGDVGTTQLSFDWNGIAVSGTLPTVPDDYYLIIDTDGDGNFTTGTQIVNNVGGFSSTNVIRYSGLALPEGAVFTFGISKKVTWTGGTSTNWNLASNWNTNTVPNATNCVIIPNVTTNNPIISGTNTTSNAYTLEVKTGGSLTVNSTNTLSVAQTVTVESGGTLTFEDQSSLVQDAATTSNSNSGEITYKRISSPMKNFDYTYWSSPVTGQTAKLLSPNTLADKYFRFDGKVAVNDWVFDDGVMTPGVGFIIRVPKPGSPAPDNWSGITYSQPVAFKGTPNNGNYSFLAGANELNLIGNPYPSAIRADDFINANTGIIYGALYFWTHNTAISPSGSDYVYTADDYATYNITGGTAGGPLPIPLSGPATSPGLNTSVPNGFIAAGQSFFVENAAAGSFQFTNAMRVEGNNTQFFKQANTKKTATVEKNRVWLNLTNSGGAFKQLLVGYITGATNDWDNMYDGPTFDGQEFVDFYSINQGKNLTIQGRALPFANTDIVPLGYRSTIAGAFDISIDKRDGALAGQEIWLEDKKTNTLHELTKGKYTFTAINGVENDRFVLKYTNKTLGTDDNEVADKSLIVSVKNKKITLTSSAEAITQVQLFDLLGRKVYDKSKINAQEWSISNLPSSEQTLIVKTTLANGAISNKKIIY